MAAETDQAHARRAVAERLAAARRLCTRLIVAASVVEGLLLVVVLLVTDFTDPVQRLVLACSVLVYGTLGLGLVALGAYVRWQAERVLAALDGAAD